MRRCLAVLVFISLAAATAANDTVCPALQTEALSSIIAGCAEQEAGTLCLGHPTVAAIPRPPGSSAGALRQPGDTLPVDSLDWLVTSSEDQTWGAARAVFTAYAGDSLEAREVALVVFGNVALFFPPPVEPPSPLVDLTVTAATRRLPARPARYRRPDTRAARSPHRAQSHRHEPKWQLAVGCTQRRVSAAG